jgi:hypothetical protein
MRLTTAYMEAVEANFSTKLGGHTNKSYYNATWQRQQQQQRQSR